jgi:hypothetical protein
MLPAGTSGQRRSLVSCNINLHGLRFVIFKRQFQLIPPTSNPPGHVDLVSRLTTPIRYFVNMSIQAWGSFAYQGRIICLNLVGIALHRYCEVRPGIAYCDAAAGRFYNVVLADLNGSSHRRVSTAIRGFNREIRSVSDSSVTCLGSAGDGGESVPRRWIAGAGDG